MFLKNNLIYLLLIIILNYIYWFFVDKPFEKMWSSLGNVFFLNFEKNVMIKLDIYQLYLDLKFSKF